jgi:hypothetical protein
MPGTFGGIAFAGLLAPQLNERKGVTTDNQTRPDQQGARSASRHVAWRPFMA